MSQEDHPLPTGLTAKIAAVTAFLIALGALIDASVTVFTKIPSVTCRLEISLPWCSAPGDDRPKTDANLAPKPDSTPPVADQFPDTFDLIFRLELADNSPYLAEDQVHIVVPAKRWSNYLGRHPEGYYTEQFDTPGKTSSFSAFVTRKVETGYTSQPPITSFCLRRADPPPDNAKMMKSVAMQCKEGVQPCATFGDDDQKLLALCARINGPGQRGSLRGASRFASLVFGTAMAASQQRVWSIPSLDSLLARKSANELRDGFTVFTIQSAQKVDVEADAVSLDLAVKDAPVLIEGLPAALQPHSFDPEQPVTLKFGLQNLDFEGRYAGCDRITAQLQFYKDAVAVGAPVSLELLYAALRNVESSAIQTSKGTFTWSASYEVSNPQNKRTDWRVFVRTAARSELAKLEPSGKRSTISGSSIRQAATIIRSMRFSAHRFAAAGDWRSASCNRPDKLGLPSRPKKRATSRILLNWNGATAQACSGSSIEKSIFTRNRST
jgi:hypothetical protein